MRLMTRLAPVSINDDSRPVISHSALIGITLCGGASCPSTLNCMDVRNLVPLMESLPRAITLPDLLGSSYSTITLALNETLAGPNFTANLALNDPSSFFSPSTAPSTHSTTAFGSERMVHTACGVET